LTSQKNAAQGEFVLIAQGLMTEMGMRAIETAKKDRRWKEN
jgi:hypothetical protein